MLDFSQPHSKLIWGTEVAQLIFLTLISAHPISYFSSMDSCFGVVENGKSSGIQDAFKKRRHRSSKEWGLGISWFYCFLHFRDTNFSFANFGALLEVNLVFILLSKVLQKNWKCLKFKGGSFFEYYCYTNIPYCWQVVSMKLLFRRKWKNLSQHWSTICWNFSTLSKTHWLYLHLRIRTSEVVMSLTFKPSWVDKLKFRNSTKFCW